MFKRSAVHLAIAIVWSGPCIEALAQDAAAGSTQRVEITGSHIRRIDAETVAPIQVFTRADIERTGKDNVTDIIRSLPVDNNGSISTGFSSGFAAGASGVSLRGLGANATLVLINGRRLAPYGLADDGQRSFVDLGSIPLDAVERIEVLKDGASAIYGSDAIAGVVNVILRRSFKGIEAQASHSRSGYGDADVSRASITAGHGDLGKDGYNVFVNFEATDQKGLKQSQRGSRAHIGSGDLTPYGYDFEAGNVLGWIDTSTANRASSNRWGAVRGPGNVYTQLPGCTNPAPAPSGYAGCPYDLVQTYVGVTPPQQTSNLLFRGVLDVSAAVQPYLELSQLRSKVQTLGTPAAVSSTWANPAGGVFSNVNIQLPANHPDNPLGQSGRLRYLTHDVGGRNNDYDSTVTRLVMGSKGTVGAWDYDAGALHARSVTDRSATGYLRNSVLNDLLAGTNLSGQNPGLSFYRLGDDAGLNSPALYAALSPRLLAQSKTTVSSVDARFSRDLMNLPGGALGLAMGAEFRRETLDSPGLPYTDLGEIVGLGYSFFKGKRTVTAVYAELVAPLSKSLELNLAARNDRYSDYGNSFTPKFGFKWVPTKAVALRGSVANGFRAPGAAESGASGSGGFTTYSDPIRCPVTGRAADCGNGSTGIVNVGNPDIRPETSTSFSLGLVLEPLAGTSATFDLWQIVHKDQITPTNAQGVLDNPAAFPNAQILRDNDDLPGIPNSGTVQSVSSPYLNSNRTVTNGIDVDLRQRFDLGAAGRLSANLTWSYTHSFKLELANGQTFEYANTHGPTALSGNAGMPQHRALMGLAWDRGPLNLALQATYVGGMNNRESAESADCLNHFADGSDAPSGCRIPSFTTVDLSTRWKASANLELFASIQNLFDRVAPLDPQTYGGFNFNPTYHMAGAVGRTFKAGVKLRF